MACALAAFSVSAAPLTPMRQNHPIHRGEAGKTTITTKAPAKVAENDVITEAPDGGKGQAYAVSSYAWYTNADYSAEFGTYSSAGEVVFTADAAYIKNPVVGYATDTYLKAEKVDDETYVAKLPFHLYDYDYYGTPFPYYLQICEKVESPYSGADYEPTDETEVTYKLVDGQFHLDLGYEPSYDTDGNLLPPEKILGLFDDYGWCFAGDAAQTWVPVDVEAQLAPAGLDTEDWQLIANNWGRNIKVGFDGNDIWLTGLSDYLPDGWVKGTVDGDKVILDSYQYLGMSLGQFIYYVTAEDSEDAAGVKIIDSYEFAYDAATKTIKANNPAIYMMYNGSATDEVFYLDYWNNPVICMPPVDMDFTPQAAMDLDWGDYFGYWGFNVFQFAVTNLSVDNYALDTANLYYRILFDGEVQTFYAEDSEGALEEDMTNIPFNGTYYDYFYDYDTNRQVYVYVDGLDSIGVQMVYIDADGKEYPSEVATLEFGSVGVGSITNTEAKESGCEYYDLNGKRVMNPGSGIFVVKSTLTDGTVKVAKKMLRK